MNPIAFKTEFNTFHSVPLYLIAIHRLGRWAPKYRLGHRARLAGVVKLLGVVSVARTASDPVVEPQISFLSEV